MSSDLGQMVMNVFNATSYHGFKLDSLKSGLQKYIRRGNIEKATYCLNEILLFKKSHDPKRTKAILTNLRNRLCIIMHEDTTFNNYDLFIKGTDILKQWDSERTDDDLLLKLVHHNDNSINS